MSKADEIPTITRRAALATIGAALTTAGVSTAVVAPVLAGPAPDAIGALVDEAQDPLLDLVEAFNRGYADFERASAELPPDEDVDDIADATFGPALAALKAGALPPATTLAGAVAALRLVVVEADRFGDDDYDVELVRAALRYLEGRA
jgi:hypothetical protein